MTAEASVRRRGSRSRDERIGVIYLTDGNRDDLTYFSIVALGLMHARPLDIHVVQAGFSDRPPDSVRAILRLRGHRLATHPLQPAARGALADRQAGSALHGHITGTALAKVEAIAAIAPEYRMVCYLDNDTLTMSAIDLSTVMPRSRPVAAVPDLSISTGLEFPKFFDNCAKNGLAPRYFNSGVLLIDVDRWQDLGIAARYELGLRSHAQFCPYRDGTCTGLFDQCVLNLAVSGDWDVLPLDLNVQKSAFQTRLWTEARIRHYTGAEKFLPARPHRADRKELALLTRIAKSIPELRVRVPNDYLGLPYWVNGIRRTNARQTIARLLADQLIGSAAASGRPGATAIASGRSTPGSGS